MAQYRTRGERQRFYESMMKKSGRRRVCFWLTEEAIDNLARSAGANGTDRSSVIEALIEKAI